MGGRSSHFAAHADCRGKAPHEAGFSAWGKAFEPQTFLVPLDHVGLEPENVDELFDSFQDLPVLTKGSHACAQAGHARAGEQACSP